MTPGLFKDLHWFRTLLKQCNGVSMYEVRHISANIYLDASLTGLGGAFGDFGYTLPIPRNFHNCNIVQLEMLIIVVALKVWAQLWQNRHISIYCDN